MRREKWLSAVAFLVCLVCSAHVVAQHHHEGMPGDSSGQQMKMDSDSLPKKKAAGMGDMDMKHMDMSGHSMKHDHGMNMDMGMSMSSSFSKNLPMSRDGSGTGWLPDASPVYAIMKHHNGWMYMLHGNIALDYTNQDFTGQGVRGGIKFSVPNWIMLMAQKPVGKRGLFHYSIMMSLDPLTLGGYGYPLIFQSGESWKGSPLVDRQHPHDLFSELSVSYSYAFSKKSDLFVYAGYPGEPALGSVAFMHRPSALADPDAPITHHWNDGTHITFGVTTLGFRYDRFKLEGSLFTGREPDENRYNFDKPRFDSRSARLSYNPGQHWALQVSTAYLKSPEALHPGEDVYRSTASATAAYPLGDDKIFTGTVLWGLNKLHDHEGENAVLGEAALTIKKATIYTRYEWVEKTSEELNLPFGFPFYTNTDLFPVSELVLGATYDLFHVKPVNLALGAQISYYTSDSQLKELYGKHPLGGEIFLRIYPRRLKM